MEKAKVPFHLHNIEKEDTELLLKTLEGPFLSTGALVEEFESKLEKFLTYGHTIKVLGVSSCTAALHLALLAEGIGKGDEVITTPMTFIATINSILYTGAKPVFTDVDPKTGCIDPEKVKEKITSKTKAILVVHLYGLLCDVDKIDAFGIPIIEDAAHALETNGVGLWGSSCFSFYPTKSITSGEGGAISILDEDKLERVKKLRLHGMDKGAWKRYMGAYQHWDMAELGYKYNMTNLQAALLLPQFNKMGQYLERRKRIHKYYQDNIKGLRLLETSHGSSKLMFTIITKPDKRDKLLNLIQEEGVGVAVNFRAVPTLEFYKKKFKYKGGEFPEAEAIGDGTITLPLYPKMTDNQVEYVVEVIKRCLKKL